MQQATLIECPKCHATGTAGKRRHRQSAFILYLVLGDCHQSYECKVCGHVFAPRTEYERPARCT